MRGTISCDRWCEVCLICASTEFLKGWKRKSPPLLRLKRKSRPLPKRLGPRRSEWTAPAPEFTAPQAEVAGCSGRRPGALWARSLLKTGALCRPLNTDPQRSLLRPRNGYEQPLSGLKLLSYKGKQNGNKVDRKETVSIKKKKNPTKKTPASSVTVNGSIAAAILKDVIASVSKVCSFLNQVAY